MHRTRDLPGIWIWSPPHHRPTSPSQLHTCPCTLPGAGTSEPVELQTLMEISPHLPWPCSGSPPASHRSVLRVLFLINWRVVRGLTVRLTDHLTASEPGKAARGSAGRQTTQRQAISGAGSNPGRPTQCSPGRVRRPGPLLTELEEHVTPGLELLLSTREVTSPAPAPPV